MTHWTIRTRILASFTIILLVMALMSGVAYRDFVIDAYRRDVDRWRATIRRSNGKKIRIASPPSVRDEATTTADAITAEKAIEFARRAIDLGEVI